MKRVLALPGQTVCRNGLDIIAYGATIGHARERDNAGRKLPVWQGCRRIADDELFLMNSMPRTAWTAAISARSRAVRSSAARSPSGPTRQATAASNGGPATR